MFYYAMKRKKCSIFVIFLETNKILRSCFNSIFILFEMSFPRHFQGFHEKKTNYLTNKTVRKTT